MKKLPEEIKTLRRKIKPWFGVLTYDNARGKLDRGITANRLKSVIEPLLKSESIEAITNDSNLDLPEVDDATMKKRILRKMNPDNFSEKLSDIHEMLKASSLDDKDNPSLISNGFTMIILRWAQITGQDLGFVRRATQRLAILFKEWQTETGLHSFSDSETYQNPKEYGRFFSRFSHILLEETPEEALSKARKFFIDTIKKYPEINLESVLKEVLPPVTGYITRKTEEKLNSAFKTNPKAKRDISSPEVGSLAELEKKKQGWGGDMNKATELLEEGIKEELSNLEYRPDKATLTSTVKSVGRQSLISNIYQALDGKLKPRFIDAITKAMKRIYRQVKSYWDFSESGIDSNYKSIQQWLFRRGENGKSK